ncbi:type II toxin-antitoxin system Phd/YefM family antitoxin [Candidatus Hydrogenedentota bacterium]
MTTISATEARKKLYRLLDEVYDSHEPVHISGKRHSGVLVSEEDWRSIMETLHLHSVPGMRESIIKGMKTPVEECSKDPGW